ncbi:hypothetical protein Tco_0789608 [Tanacetum coccineum]
MGVFGKEADVLFEEVLRIGDNGAVHMGDGRHVACDLERDIVREKKEKPEYFIRADLAHGQGQYQQVKDIRFDSYFDTVFGIWNMVYRYSIFLQGVDRYNKDSERPDTNVERSNTTPLLDDKTIKTPVASTSSLNCELGGKYEKKKKANEEVEMRKKAIEDKRVAEEQERKRKAEQDRKNAKDAERLRNEEAERRRRNAEAQGGGCSYRSHHSPYQSVNCNH